MKGVHSTQKKADKIGGHFDANCLFSNLALTESKGLRALKNWSLSKLSPKEKSQATNK